MRRATKLTYILVFGSLVWGGAGNPPVRGEDGLFAKRRPTLMFNGYEAQVGQLYAGLDLKKNF